MFEEPWMQEARRDLRRAARLRTRPVCMDCKMPITDEKCLPMEGGCICPRCVDWRMVETDVV